MLKNISFFPLLVCVPCFGLAPHIDYKKVATKNKAGQAETLVRCVARGMVTTDAEYLAQLQRCARRFETHIKKCAPHRQPEE